VRHLSGVLDEHLADEQPLQVGLAMPDLQVAPGELLQADPRLRQLRLLRVPALEDRVVPIVEARGLVKRFGEVEALAGLDLVAPAGQVLALLGPNGAGKTTFIRASATLARPDAGTLLGFRFGGGAAGAPAAIGLVAVNALAFARIFVWLAGARRRPGRPGLGSSACRSRSSPAPSCRSTRCRPCWRPSQRSSR